MQPIRFRIQSQLYSNKLLNGTDANTRQSLPLRREPRRDAVLIGTTARRSAGDVSPAQAGGRYTADGPRDVPGTLVSTGSPAVLGRIDLSVAVTVRPEALRRHLSVGLPSSRGYYA